jgi:hypothetical protein
MEIVQDFSDYACSGLNIAAHEGQVEVPAVKEPLLNLSEMPSKVLSKGA